MCWKDCNRHDERTIGLITLREIGSKIFQTITPQDLESIHFP